MWIHAALAIIIIGLDGGPVSPELASSEQQSEVSRAEDRVAHLLQLGTLMQFEPSANTARVSAAVWRSLGQHDQDEILESLAMVCEARGGKKVIQVYDEVGSTVLATYPPPPPPPPPLPKRATPKQTTLPAPHSRQDPQPTAAPPPSTAPVPPASRRMAEPASDTTIQTAARMVLLLLGMLVGLMIYFIPSFIAVKRRHHHRGSIIVVNVFLGWTFLGWVAALAIACSHVKARPAFE